VSAAIKPFDPFGCPVAANSAGPSVAGPDAQPPLHALGKDDNGRTGTVFSRRLRIAARPPDAKTRPSTTSIF
jgi:hypothetical protein